MCLPKQTNQSTRTAAAVTHIVQMSIQMSSASSSALTALVPEYFPRNFYRKVLKRKRGASIPLFDFSFVGKSGTTTQA